MKRENLLNNPTFWGMGMKTVRQVSAMWCAVLSALAMTTTVAFAKDPVVAFFQQDRDAFYESSANQHAFERAKSSGQLQRSKDYLWAKCNEQASNDQEKQECTCLSEFVDKTSLEEIFYDSTVTYNLQIEKEKAREARNKERYQALARIAKKRVGLMDRAKQQCKVD